MSIAVDLRSLMGGRISGVENYVINAVNDLGNKIPDLKAFYNTSKNPEFPGLNAKIKVIKTSIPNKILNTGMAFFGFPKLEDLYGGFEVLWMPDMRPFALRKKTKLALTVHDLSPVMQSEHYSLKRRIWHLVNRYQRAFKRADLFFAMSEYTKYDLQKVFGIPAEKIKVVYPGIDPRHFNTNLDLRLKRKVKEKYRLPENFILSISTVEPRKNITALVEAFEKINDSNIDLVIAGKLGWLYKGLLKRIAASPKRKQIKVIGYVDEKDKPFMISLSRIVCYPSYYEGFGFPPLEAMACGVPSITSARTSMPEVCGDAAILIEPYHINDLTYALNQLNEDKGLREVIIEKGLQRVKAFSWQKCTEEINTSLLSLLS